METAWKAGLEDVIATRSAICQVDGAAGKLYYRGYEIGEVAGTIPFEDVTALLWHGELPAPAASARFASRLEAARGLPAAVADLLRTLPLDSHPLDQGRPHLDVGAVAHEQDAIQLHRRAELGGEAVDQDLVSWRYSVLLAAADDDGRQRSIRLGHERRYYRTAGSVRDAPGAGAAASPTGPIPGRPAW